MKESDIRPEALYNRFLELSREGIADFFANQSQFRPVQCPACGSTDPEPGLVKFGFHYVLCRRCGSLYNSPRPTTDMINAYYRDSEAAKFWVTTFYKETAEARREKLFRPRGKLVAEWMPCHPSRHPNPRVFVDIGCGYGIFLSEVAKLEQFDEVCGIEPAPNMAAVGRAQGFKVIEKTAEEVEEGELQACFATAFEVMEHVLDPFDLLRAARRVLHPGGILLLTTVTVTGFDVQVLWENSNSIYPPHHLNLVSVEGMEQLVRRSGFEILELSTPGVLDVELVRNALEKTPSLPVPRFARQIVQNTNAKVQEDFQAFLRANRLSSHIRVVAKAARPA